MSKLLTTLSSLVIASALVVSGCVFKKPPVPPAVNQNQNTNTAATTTEIDTSDWKTYRNEALGVEFSYDAFDQYSGKEHFIQEENDKILLYVKGNNFGLTITVLDIESSAPEEYLKNNYMRGIDQACKINIQDPRDTTSYQLKGDYHVLFISSEPDKSTYETNCGPYGNNNAIAYFLYNKNMPEKLLWVSIGQDTSLEHYRDFQSSITIF